MSQRPISRVLALVIAVGAIGAAALPPNAAHAEATILVDAVSGKVLEAENATYPWYPASVTKLMTLYVTLKAIKDHRITPDTLFTVSPNAFVQSPTKMGFGVGTQVTVDNALKMMMVKSANDMAVLLAEGIDGSIESFAEEMTHTAHSLGMSESNFVNPNGLPADGQVTSARDLAILARALIRDFPEYDFYWHIPAIKFGRRIIRNYNTLLGRYPGADGMKTGFICASGYNLVATATRSGKRLIAVVLGAPSSAARAIKAAELLESGFTQNPLAWLMPALGSVDGLAPINADPPNLHDQICGPHRKHPAAEEEEAATGSESGGVDTPFSAMLSSLRAPTPKGAALLSDFGAVTPVVVYTGPTRSAAELAHLNEVEMVPHHKKKSIKAADTHSAEGKEESAGEKRTERKSAGKKSMLTEKHASGRTSTATSSSTLAASPPPELQTRSATEKPKKHKAAKAAVSKPAAAQ
jgi:D-alanyl-D-alanine carboxypeptidase